MPEKTREELKVYYEQGSAPMQGQHEDLIDSFLNIVDDSAGIIQPSPLGKTLFVDGNAVGAGVRGNVYQPYKNPSQALANAINGDTIIILPGEYTCTNLYKPGVNYYAFPGVVIVHEDPFYGLFDDSIAGVGTMKFNGFAKFIEKAIWVNNTLGSKISIEGISLYVTAEANNTIMGYGQGTVSVHIKNIVFNSINAFILTGGIEANVYSEVVRIETPSYDTNFIVLSGGQDICTLEIEKLYANTYNPLDNTPFLFLISPTSIFRVKKTKINTSVSRLLNGVGMVMLDRVQVVMTNEQTIAFFTSEGTTVKNSEIYHVSPSANNYCMTGSQVEIIGTLTSNLPLAFTSVIITMGEFNYDTNLILI